MFHKVFYFISMARQDPDQEFDDEGPGDEVPSTDPVSISTEELLDVWVPRLANEDDYIGIIDDESNMMQISLDDAGGGYGVELLDPDARMSYRQAMERPQLFELLNRLPGVFERTRFPGFEPVKW